MSEPAGAPVADDSPLAVICGGGSLPFAVADAVVRRGRRVVLFAIRGWADPQRVAAYPHYWAEFGQFGRFCRVAREAGCRDVVFIGSVVRPAIWQIRPDFKTLGLLPRIFGLFRGGDDHLLKGVAAIFEELWLPACWSASCRAGDSDARGVPRLRAAPRPRPCRYREGHCVAATRSVHSTWAKRWSWRMRACWRPKQRRGPTKCLRGSRSSAAADE